MQGVGKRLEGQQRHVCFAALDLTKVRAMQACLFGQLDLTPTTAKPEPLDGRSDGALRVLHTAQSAARLAAAILVIPIIAQRPLAGGFVHMAEQLLTPPSIAHALPTMVRSELATLSAAKQQEFVEEFTRKSKSVGVAYVLWLLLGWHYAYLGKWGIQFLYWVTVGGLFVWAFIDLFRIPGLVRDFNKDVAVDVLRNQRAIAGAR